MKWKVGLGRAYDKDKSELRRKIYMLIIGNVLDIDLCWILFLVLDRVKLSLLAMTSLADFCCGSWSDPILLVLRLWHWHWHCCCIMWVGSLCPWCLSCLKMIEVKFFVVINLRRSFCRQQNLQNSEPKNSFGTLTHYECCGIDRSNEIVDIEDTELRY